MSLQNEHKSVEIDEKQQLQKAKMCELYKSDPRYGYKLVQAIKLYEKYYKNVNINLIKKYSYVIVLDLSKSTVEVVDNIFTAYGDVRPVKIVCIDDGTEPESIQYNKSLQTLVAVYPTPI